MPFSNYFMNDDSALYRLDLWFNVVKLFLQEERGKRWRRKIE